MAQSSHKMVQMVNEVLKLKNVTEDKQKHALMLHCVGGEVHLIFETSGTPDELGLSLRLRKAE